MRTQQNSFFWTNPHTHKGYFHSEKGTFTLSEKERKMVDKVIKIWENKVDKS